MFSLKIVKLKKVISVERGKSITWKIPKHIKVKRIPKVTLLIVEVRIDLFI